MSFAITPGTWLLIFLAAAAMAWPSEAHLFMERAWLEVRIIHMEMKLYLLQRLLHWQLCRLAKKTGLPAPGPFKYTSIRERL